MDDLFRWMTVRAPQATDADVTVSLTGPLDTTSFQTILYNILHSDGPPGPWSDLVAAARNYQESNAFAVPVDFPKLTAFEAAVDILLASPQIDLLEKLQIAVENVWGPPIGALLANEEFTETWTRVNDSVVALFIAPIGGGSELMRLAHLSRVIALIVRVVNADYALDEPAGVLAALQRTLLLPPTIFPINPGMAKPVGIADLLVVRQHIARYELADLSSVENVMPGESKKHMTQHTLMTQNERTVEVESTSVTEEELQTDERLELKGEVSNVLKEDLSVKAGVKATFTFDDVLSTTAKADVSHSEAKNTATKLSSEYAKDVVARAASKVTARALSRQVHKVTELFDENDEHSFTAKGIANIGLYQWVSKVYTSQIFNFGKRLLFDLTVPEPGAFLLDAVASHAGISNPRAPEPFTLLATDIEHKAINSPNHYGALLAKYGVIGFTTPPPPDYITVAKGLSLQSPNSQDSHAVITWSGELPITEGYAASQISVNGTFNIGASKKGDFLGFRITVGVETFVYGCYHQENDERRPGWMTVNNPTPAEPPITQYSVIRPAQQETISMPIALSAERAADCSVVVELGCWLTPEGLNAWKAKVYTAVLQAYNKLQAEYLEQVQAGTIRSPLKATLGGNPDQNRRLEQAELKKAAIQILSRRDLVETPLGAINETPPVGVPQPQPPASARTYPRPDLQLAQDQGRFIRFFEQAFEWENMTYLFYPYYWARADTWYDLSLLEHDDPLFGEFLRAGEARVVIPVRPGFEADVQYFLLTSQLWGGGDMPNITDTDYLPITEEIKAATGAPAGEVPQGEPWEVRVPTTLIRLRNGSETPKWLKSGDWTWTSS